MRTDYYMWRDVNASYLGDSRVERREGALLYFYGVEARSWVKYGNTVLTMGYRLPDLYLLLKGIPLA